MRVALVAVAITQGLQFEDAEALVDEVSSELGDVDGRTLAREVFERANARVWAGADGRALG